MASTKVQRTMTQPINLIFRFLRSKARIQIWLFEQKDLRIEGRITGFDEYMNLVLDEAEEVSIKKKSRKPLGRILLKGDNITLMMNIESGFVGASAYGNSGGHTSNQMDNDGNESPRNPDLDGLTRLEKNINVELTDAQVAAYRWYNLITVEGQDIPKPVRSFRDVGFPDHVLQEIEKAGFTKPKPIQSQGWPMALKKRHLIGIAETGSGKTLSYLLPAIVHVNAQQILAPTDGPIVLVLAPTDDLAAQIQQEASKFCSSSKIKSTCIVSGVPEVLGVEMVIATPQRLTGVMESNRTYLRMVTYLVLDEADQMLDMGFEPQIQYFFSQIRQDCQTMIWSATWPEGLEQLSKKFLGDPNKVIIGSSDLKNKRALPIDILLCIFSRVPAKSVARFSALSKFWGTMFRNPYFVEQFVSGSLTPRRLLFSSKSNNELVFYSLPQTQDPSQKFTHITRYRSFSFMDDCWFEILPPVHGFVLLEVHNISPTRTEWLVILNPVTGEMISLHLPNVGTKVTLMKTHFGYDPIWKQFKILCEIESPDETIHPLWVLALETRVWKEIRCSKPHSAACNGVCINGQLYYAANASEEESEFLVCFDLGLEKFSFIKLDEGTLQECNGWTMLNNRGKLALFSLPRIAEASDILKMWLLEDPDKNKWLKHTYAFSSLLSEDERHMAKHGLMKPIGSTTLGEFVMSPMVVVEDYFRVFFYNLKKNTLMRIDLPKFPPESSPLIYTFPDFLENLQIIHEQDTQAKISKNELQDRDRAVELQDRDRAVDAAKERYEARDRAVAAAKERYLARKKKRDS